MLRKTLLGIAAVLVLGLLAYVAMSAYSRRAPPLGLVDGRLRACPQRPNCVSSESNDAAASIAPLGIDAGQADTAWRALLEAIEDLGGEVRAQRPDYLHATFTTRVFRFVDDLEARRDPERGVIHLRSASRVGYSDRGLNRERVERLRQRYAQRLGAGS